jgi:hypothetical protein
MQHIKRRLIAILLIALPFVTLGSILALDAAGVDRFGEKILWPVGVAAPGDPAQQERLRESTSGPGEDPAPGSRPAAPQDGAPQPEAPAVTNDNRSAHDAASRRDAPS